MTEQHQFRTTDRTIPYELIFSGRKTLGITIYPELRMVVRAPNKMPKGKIDGFLKERERWILKQWRKFEENPPPPKAQYIDGEMHYILGQQYPLEVHESSRYQGGFNDKVLLLYTPDPTNLEKNEKAIKRWYRREARKFFNDRLAVCYDEMSHLNIPYPDIRIKDMKTRWGSCSGRTDLINLNLKLMQCPVEYIDYVIVHELCHFLVRNHSKDFYNLMGSIIPDWKQLRTELNDFPIRQ